MTEKRLAPWWWTLPAAIILGGGAVLLGRIAGFGGQSLAAPLTGLGGWLRELSLGGPGGDLMAWAAVLCISALPALGLLWRGRRRADLLLILAGCEIFFGLYFLVNPTLLRTGLPVVDMWALTALWTVAATLTAWAILRLLERMDRVRKLGESLGKLLVFSAVLLVFFGTAALTADLLREIDGITQANVNSNITETATYHVLTFLWGLDVVLNAMTADLLLRGSQLARLLDDAPFSQEAVTTAENISRHCRRVAAAALLVCVLGNLAQMIFFSQTRSIHVSVNLPVAAIVLSVCLRLLCRWLQQGRALKADNDSII